MKTITEGAITYEIPVEWKSTKLDEWAFFKNRFQKLGSGLRLPCHRCGAELVCNQCKTRKSLGMKAVDFVLIDPRDGLWLIELKDYRRHRRLKSIDIADEVALKVRDSLAILLAASFRADQEFEREFADNAVRCSEIRIVLHLEQPERDSKLYPKSVDLANFQIRAKQLLHAIDPHPNVWSCLRITEQRGKSPIPGATIRDRPILLPSRGSDAANSRPHHVSAASAPASRNCNCTA